MAKTRNFAEVIRKKLAKDADLAALVEQESFNAHIASEIHNAREAAALTQAELAERLGTHQPVIARLENADYDGHSLAMLRRIAEVLSKRLRVEFYAPPSYVAAAECTIVLPKPEWTKSTWKPGYRVRRSRTKVS
jgi:transcriptional regulator with XRE-family HTH domain